MMRGHPSRVCVMTQRHTVFLTMITGHPRLFHFFVVFDFCDLLPPRRGGGVLDVQAQRRWVDGRKAAGIIWLRRWKECNEAFTIVSIFGEEPPLIGGKKASKHASERERWRSGRQATP